jgi:hypothetical protein
VARRLTAAGAALALIALTIAPAAADLIPSPTQWPASATLAPLLGANAHGIRIAGADRYQTNLATSLTLRGQGGYPFSSPDRSSGWWGPGACPAAIVVVAGDSSADALAAASLSDPTDQSSEPQLPISATADPSFFGAVGASRRVDTELAPIVLSRSTRDGSTGLSSTAQTSAFDFAQGACSANEAIVVGGAASVPVGVDEQLISLGYDRVFRAAGADRYATAAVVAKALGTGAPEVQACPDADSTDGATRTGFLGNAAVELRSGPLECAVLSRSIVLADGIVGADALAAGWWTSLWQVPVLLTGAGGSLPPATRDTLSLLSLQIDNVIVLGGSARIPDETVAETAALASATPHRIAGADRYATSARMAQAFGGWYPTGDGTDFAGSMVCLAASAGSSSGSSPDALGAGPWCAAVSGAAGGPGAPARAAAPVSGPAATVLAGGVRPAHDLVPVLLVAPGSRGLPPSVRDLLSGAFDTTTEWCSGSAAAPGCAAPGFAIGFGGVSVLTPDVMGEAARHLSGGISTTSGDLAPSLAPAFWTALDMAPVAHLAAGAGSGADQACVPRGALVEVRWLAAWNDDARTQLRSVLDASALGIYAGDADGGVRTPGRSAPACVGLGVGPPTVRVGALSLSGHATPLQTLDLARRLTLAPAIHQAGPESSAGASSSSTEPGAVTALEFNDQVTGRSIALDGEQVPVSAVTLRVTLTRGPVAAGPVTFDGTLSLVTGRGELTADIAGEAVFDQQVWRLRGRTDLRGGLDTAGGAGGFVADLDTGAGPASADDQVSWDIDALLP